MHSAVTCPAPVLNFCCFLLLHTVSAAARHLARKHQLYGSSEKEMAQVDMLIDGVEVSRAHPGGVLCCAMVGWGAGWQAGRQN